MDKKDELHATSKTEDWSRLLKSKYKKEMGEISREYPHKRSLKIDYRDVERFGKVGIALADELLVNPGKVLEDVWDAIKNGQLIRTKDGKEPKGINIRFINLPKKVGIRNIRSDHINTFVSVEGILRKITEVRPRIVEATFRCPAGISPEKFRNTGNSSSRTAVQPTGVLLRNWSLSPSSQRL